MYCQFCGCCGFTTLYGFLALDSDLKTIRGITFYEHGETPGLGGEVDNPRWKAQWKGKMAYDDNMKILIEVLKGQVDPTSPQAGHQIDGLGGSTITTRGVHNLVRFWLGENGYKPFLSNIGKEVAS
jgi:Na+-transporting NADH:ubiquinone oxidoreductase subunit C